MSAVRTNPHMHTCRRVLALIWARAPCFTRAICPSPPPPPFPANPVYRTPLYAVTKLTFVRFFCQVNVAVRIFCPYTLFHSIKNRVLAEKIFHHRPTCLHYRSLSLNSLTGSIPKELSALVRLSRLCAVFFFIKSVI